ncbi:hypothetical protein D4R42_00210 [bacterium]|nr:MAG: hypothetical protein D4R42_00210 [bacterium]
MRYRYTGDLGCRHRGVPHDLIIVHENAQTKWEVCKICGKKFKWNKGFRGRVANAEYLKIHVRDFAQKSGATRRIYNKIYNQSKMIIKI